MVQTSWTDSLSGICFVVILFVFCFSFKTVFLAGYPANRISGKRNRISGKRNRISGRIPDTKKGRISGRISGATLKLSLLKLIQF